MKEKILKLFEIPGIVVKVPTIWLFKNIVEDTFQNAHIFVRYKAIQSFFYKSNEYWWNIYNFMQRKRVLQMRFFVCAKIERLKYRKFYYFKSNFKALIKSFEKNGFIDEYPITLNEDFKLLDGSHRIALALYFNIEYVTITMKEKNFNMHPPRYDIKWFEENGFNEEVIQDIKNCYSEIIIRSEKNE